MSKLKWLISLVAASWWGGWPGHVSGQTVTWAAVESGQTTGPASWAVVGLYESSTGRPLGTGVFVDRNSVAMLVTSEHLVVNQKSPVLVIDHFGKRMIATVVKTDHSAGLAMLKAISLSGQRSGMWAVKLAAKEPGIGAPVSLVGWDYRRHTLRAKASGAVVHYYESPQDPRRKIARTMRVSCLAQAGDSGGALFDAKNQLVGVVWGGTGDRQGQGMATPHTELVRFFSAPKSVVTTDHTTTFVRTGSCLCERCQCCMLSFTGKRVSFGNSDSSAVHPYQQQGCPLQFPSFPATIPSTIPLNSTGGPRLVPEDKHGNPIP